MSQQVGQRQTRRKVLASALSGGAGAIVAAGAATLGLPRQALAAAGDALRIGRSNDAGGSQTTLNSAALGASFTLKTTNNANGATGIFGWASSTYNTVRGVYGRSDSDEGIGVHGVAASSVGDGWGVAGRTDSTTGGVGAGGWVPAGPGFGVLGISDTVEGWGVYAAGDMGVDGDLYVTGFVSKGGGGFQIDHPLDPEGKVLNHSFVESPDMKNLYDGVATLDSTGSASITLPPWFGQVNRDFRYQLSPIGHAMPSLHVSAEIDSNAFSISGGVAGGKVSWTVTGIRRDAWANAHRIQVEQPKGGKLQGRMLHPELYGAPASTAMGAKARAAVRRLTRD